MGDTTPNPELDKDYVHFQAILEDLLGKGLEGRFALVHKEALVGDYATEREAYEEGIKRFGTSIFLIQLISKEIKPESIQFLRPL